MKNQRTLVNLELVLFGSIIFANPLRAETQKAYCIEVSNGKHLGETSNALWIPKSILIDENEKVSKPDSENVVHVVKKLTLPEWFARKNKLI